MHYNIILFPFDGFDCDVDWFFSDFQKVNKILLYVDFNFSSFAPHFSTFFLSSVLFKPRTLMGIFTDLGL